MIGVGLLITLLGLFIQLRGKPVIYREKDASVLHNLHFLLFFGWLCASSLASGYWKYGLPILALFGVGALFYWKKKSPWSVLGPTRDELFQGVENALKAEGLDPCRTRNGFEIDSRSAYLMVDCFPGSRSGSIENLDKVFGTDAKRMRDLIAASLESTAAPIPTKALRGEMYLGLFSCALGVLGAWLMTQV